MILKSLHVTVVEGSALSEVEGDLQFSGLILEMFFYRVLVQVDLKVCRAYGA